GFAPSAQPIENTLSEKLEKGGQIETRLLQNMRKCRALDGTMGGNNELESFVCGPFLKTNVTASLADDQPAIAAQGINHLFIVQAGNFAPTATSKTSALG